MIPELGLISLLCALALAILLSIVPLVGVYRQRSLVIAYAIPLSYGVCFFVSLAIIILSYAFAIDDFSVLYVAQHSNTQLPLFFKLAAVWGGHEGSMLFWVFSLSIWLALVASCCRWRDRRIHAMVLAILAMIIVGLCLFTLLVSNPFERIFPALAEGRDLNPMLQDIGLIFHPPLLYLGYTGFAINFALACAALLSGRMDAAVARWSRAWALVAWIFLTAGIMLGAGWAYYELGWGGWWFWDPVENASLMPWLLGTALLHSLIATERRGCFSYWSLLLSIFTFSLSLLGTFIVRSGILTSVHAFAIDPGRGVMLLLLLGLATIGPLLLFALKVRVTTSPARFSLLSRESMLLIANTLFSIAAFIVLLGTFYPMAFSLLGLGSISVGAPYFNATFTVPMAIALIMMGIASVSRWKNTPTNRIKRLLLPMLLALIIGNMAPLLFGQWQLKVAILVTLALWVLTTHIVSINWFSLRRVGISLAHCGVAITVIGSVLSGYYTTEISIKLGPGDHSYLAGYQFTYQKTELLIGDNYTAEQATILVSDASVGKVGVNDSQPVIAVLQPERRYYNVRAMLMSEPGISSTIVADFYAVMGEKVDTEKYAIRLYYKPFIRWIWAGALFMILGGCLVFANRFLESDRLQVAKL